MEATFKKRLLAYLIDLFILSFLVVIIISIFNIDNNGTLISLNKELTNIEEEYIEERITFNDYIKEYASINYMIDKQEFLVNIINAILVIFLYILIPYFLDGQTIGKKILKIKIVKNNNKKLDLNTLIIRSILINYLGYMLITLGLIFILNSFSYFIVGLILTILELLLVIISSFMVLYKSEKRGIHDILVNTKVIDV